MSATAQAIGAWLHRSEDVENGHFEHRVIPAAGAPSVVPPGVMSSPFMWGASAGSAASSDVHESPAASENEEKSTMAREKPTGAAARRDLQLRLATALAKGATTRDQLTKQLSDLTEKQLSQLIYNATSCGRVRRTQTAAGVRAWELTTEGKHYLNARGGDDAAEAAPAPASAAERQLPRKAATKPAGKAAAKRAKPGHKVRATRAATAMFVEKAPAIAQAAFAPAVAKSFRCGLYSDGAYHLAKGDQQIELTVDETREMFDYLDRIRVDEAAA